MPKSSRKNETRGIRSRSSLGRRVINKKIMDKITAVRHVVAALGISWLLAILCFFGAARRSTMLTSPSGRGKLVMNAGSITQFDLRRIPSLRKGGPGHGAILRQDVVLHV